MAFDHTKPFRARDGRPVMIWACRWGYLWGAIREKDREVRTGWWAATGERADSWQLGSDADLVNYQPLYPDAYIEHWGNVFQAHRLYDMGIRFDTFISCPCEILEAVARNYTADRLALDDYLPLSPAQVAAIEAELVPECAHLRGGAYIEPMRHHSYAANGHKNDARIVP